MPGSLGEVFDIVSHKAIGLAINRGFQYHFIVRIGKLWPPLKADINTSAGAGKSGQEAINVRK